MNEKELVLWESKDIINIPQTAKTPEEIAKYAILLNKREIDQIVQAFNAGFYEMGTMFLWGKTMAELKKQLGTLGMEFVGEMLDRWDIDENSQCTQVMTDYEAVSLAEELGMFTQTQALRLRHALETMTHFSEIHIKEDEDEVLMMPEEAISCLRTCIQSVLGKEDFDGVTEFAKFRRSLEEMTYENAMPEIQNLLISPYFFQRTTLRVLLTIIKKLEGAQLQHALENATVIIPMMWKKLKKPDKWLIGKAYSEVHAAGNEKTTKCLRKILLQVKGFDYVPEDLRSRSFISVATNLINIHFGMNNYYNEPIAIKKLTQLGTVIPTPALKQCMTSILCVRLGNTWGVSHEGVEIAKELLKLGETRWKYYLEECLSVDSTIIAKIQNSRIVDRWCDVVKENNLANLEIKDKGIKDLLTWSADRMTSRVKQKAEKLYQNLRSEKM